MLQRALRSYQNLQVETGVVAARPGELILLVYDRLLEHALETRQLLARGEDASEPIQKAMDLIGEGLMAALDRERGGQVADNLAALYDWGIRTLLRARLKKDVELIEDFLRVYTPLREAWVSVNSADASVV